MLFFSPNICRKSDEDFDKRGTYLFRTRKSSDQVFFAKKCIHFYDSTTVVPHDVYLYWTTFFLFTNLYRRRHPKTAKKCANQLGFPRRQKISPRSPLSLPSPPTEAEVSKILGVKKTVPPPPPPLMPPPPLVGGITIRPIFFRIEKKWTRDRSGELNFRTIL